MAEYQVAKTKDLSPGEMKQVQAGRTAILLVRLEDGFHALGALCSHYEAPLAAGALCDDRVICPWHHACFSIRTGKLLEPPGLDGIPVYPVRVENDEIWVTIPEEQSVASPPRRQPGDDRVCVVAGGGCAGAYAVESLRDQGFGGRIVWAAGTQEFPPIDRPLLSKGYLSGEASEAWLPLRTEDFYLEREIEVIREQVNQLDANHKTVTLDGGEVIQYDSAILATGAVARHLPIPGIELAGIFSLHTLPEAQKLSEAAQSAKQAVIIGAGFIGMEVTQSLLKQGLKVTVIAPETIPFERILGTEIGAMLCQLHQEHGVDFRLGRTVQAFTGQDHVQKVVLDDGSQINVDLVVIGVGVQPATDFVSGVNKAKDGSIIVDDSLKAADNLYAAGDLARFPDWRTGDTIRIEHWRVAAQHGRIAGSNAAGSNQSYRGVPYFWTRQYGITLHYLGHAQQWDEIQTNGNVNEHDFIAYFLKGGKVHAVAGMEREKELALLEEKMRREGLLSLEKLA